LPADVLDTPLTLPGPLPWRLHEYAVCRDILAIA
jgi:hypothetical protein